MLRAWSLILCRNLFQQVKSTCILKICHLQDLVLDFEEDDIK